MKRRSTILWTLASAVLLVSFAAMAFGQARIIPSRGTIIQDKTFALEAGLMYLDQRGRELEVVVRQQQKEIETLKKDLKDQKEKFEKLEKKVEAP